LLPRNELPTFTTTVPSTGNQVVFRPFRVRESRNLLTATESDIQEVYRVMKDCVSACTQDLDVSKLPNFDIEFLFLEIRKKSIGETVIVEGKCPSCGNIHDVTMNLNNAKIENLENMKTDIMLSDKIGVKMRYPTLEELGKIEVKQDFDSTFQMIQNCIQKIYTQDETFDSFSKDELENWLSEELTDEQFSKIEDFIINSPYLYCSQDDKCKKCGETTKYSLKGIRSFF
jgi:hypothetical protein